MHNVFLFDKLCSTVFYWGLTPTNSTYLALKRDPFKGRHFVEQCGHFRTSTIFFFGNLCMNSTICPGDMFLFRHFYVRHSVVFSNSTFCRFLKFDILSFSQIRHSVVFSNSTFCHFGSFRFGNLNFEFEHGTSKKV
jgi:hypothetical protein